MASTTPKVLPRASSTRPCSMCSSRKAETEPWDHTASATFVGRKPTSTARSRTEHPSRSVSVRNVSVVKAPVATRLPMHGAPKRAPSSPLKTTARYVRFRPPHSTSRRATSSEAATPATPSKPPPRGTVSRCDPTSRADSEVFPASSPNVFPIASVLEVSPRSIAQRSKTAWALRSSGPKASRNHPPRGSAPISPTSRIKRAIRRGSAFGKGSGKAELLRGEKMPVTYGALREALGRTLAPVEHGDHLAYAGARFAYPGDRPQRPRSGDHHIFDQGDFLVGVQLTLDHARRSRFPVQPHYY